MLTRGRCLIGIAGILFKHNKSIASTHYNHNVEDDASQMLCEQMAWVCAHACPNMYKAQMHPSPMIHSILRLFLASVNNCLLTPGKVPTVDQ